MTVHIKVPVFPQAPVSPDPLAVYNCVNDIINYLVPLAQNFNVPSQPVNFQAQASTTGTLLTWNTPRGTSTSFYRIHRNTSAPNYAASSVIAIMPADKDPTMGQYQYVDTADFTGTPIYYWLVGENDTGAVGPVSPMRTVSNGRYSRLTTGTAMGVGAVSDDKGVAIGSGATTLGLVAAQAYGYQATPQFNNEVRFGSAAATVNEFGWVISQFASLFQVYSIEFEQTIGTGASTVTSQFLNADYVLLGAAVRVATVIPTAATFTVTLESDGTRLDSGAGVSTAANTTKLCTLNLPARSTVLQGIRITPNLAPAANSGVVRIAAVYYLLVPPTS